MDDATRDDGVYVPEEELNTPVDKDGNPLDAIELNQDEEHFEGDKSGQDELKDAIQNDNSEETANDE